ncbi:MAG: restriction endonuclease subunit S, partial [Myxococcales bacterium]|nr:restriction endonuclease subunit S [Myxococcales bacterium]
LQEQRRLVGRIKECTSRLDEVRALRTESKREADALLSGARYDAFRAESRVATLDTIIAEGPTNGLYKHSKFYGSGTAILRINNFNSGDVCTDGGELKRLQVDASELERFRLRPGDIVLNRVNGSLDVVGKACLIGNLREATVFESNMMRFSVNPAKAVPGYVLHFLASPQCRDQLKEKARIIQQASINQKDVASLKLPLPSLSEQRDIARYLDRISVLARQAVDEMSAASTVFEAVPAAVLRKAFAGEL